MTLLTKQEVAQRLGCSIRTVDRLMQNHYALVSRVLLGFVISSTLTILPLSFASAGQAAAAAACFAAGFAGAWAMARARDRRPADPM